MDHPPPTQDDSDLKTENLDLFLSLIESRLRADFTSIDLSRLISSQGVSSRGGGAVSALPSGEPSSPSKFLRLIRLVFHRAAKPVKLRVLMSVLGLDSDAIKSSSLQVEDTTDSIVWSLLEQAEQDDAKWVRVVAGILKGILFTRENHPMQDVHSFSDPACRGRTAEEELRKLTETIFNAVKEAHSTGRKVLTKAEADCPENDKQARLNSLLLCKDACPSFVPYRYSLLPPETIKAIIPEVNANNHFSTNRNASIFKVDADVEQKRAEEEGKELQQASVTIHNGAGDKGTTGAVSSVVAGRGAKQPPVVAGRMRGRFANTAGRGEDTRSSSLFLRTSSGAGRIHTGRMAGRAGSLGRIGGRVTTAGRGRAAALVGQTPLQRRLPGSTRAMLNSSARGSAGGDSSKMKMIDASEVEGLTRAQNEREKMAGMTKAERRKKLLEDAAASGLRNKKPRTDNLSANASKDQNGAVETKTPQQHDTSAPSNELGNLLEKSNKLSDEDRQNIHDFFRNRASTNPHPEGDTSGDLWKAKLHEERTIDPISGENVKETLYLELDYRTRQYKKTKKIKRK